MAEETAGADKPYEPTPRKLDEARKQGDAPKSVDLTYGFVVLGLWLCLSFAGPSMSDALGSAAQVLWSSAHQFEWTENGTLSPAPLIRALVWDMFFPALMVFAICATMAVVALLAQRSFVFSGKKLKPKPDRLSIIKNFKNKFGAEGLFGFLKSTIKLVLICVLVVLFIRHYTPDLVHLSQLSFQMSVPLFAGIFTSFVMIVALGMLALGAVDLTWQHYRFLLRNRMTKLEMTDELKNAEGDPHMKHHRRQRALELSRGGGVQNVSKADVIIVNPTHYAVALSWNKETDAAPVCIAKGIDEVAFNIRRIAEDAQIPLHHDPPTARAIHATIDIGNEITTDLYEPVAAAIRFAEDMRRKRRSRAQ